MIRTRSQKALYALLVFCFTIGLLSSVGYLGYIAYMTITQLDDSITIALIYIPKLFCFTLITYELLNITNQFSSSEFFNKKNINALRIIGTALLMCAIFVFLIRYVTIYNVRDFRFQDIFSALSFYLSEPFTYFVSGLFILLLSRVFEEGKLLQEENDLTI